MRIALVHSFYGSAVPGGENEAVCDQAAALHRAGHEVLVHAAHTDDLRTRPWYLLDCAVTVATGRGHSPARALRALVVAARAAAAVLPGFRLLVAGDGNQRVLVEEAQRPGGPVHYLGMVDSEDKARLGTVADVLMVPGAVGLVAVDSFALGTADRCLERRARTGVLLLGARPQHVDRGRTLPQLVCGTRDAAARGAGPAGPAECGLPGGRRALHGAGHGPQIRRRSGRNGP
ncbi:hypothetical protein ACFT7S_18820 [Streptomyces sp. NPDC057136]|uniref:hypothetical protein n=1 Tax=Streptomyces sp. NPDC057136 TaxID=3346029 RepID=UPI0036350FC0